MPLRGQLDRWNPNTLTINYAPRPREVYWIGVFSDATEPEFTGYHPGIIIRGARSLDIVTQTVSFVPLTTTPQQADPGTGKVPPYIHKLSANPNPQRSDPMWAICNHVITVRLTRLERYLINGVFAVPKLSEADFTAVMHAIRRGFGAIENHIKAVIEKEKAAYKELLDAEHVERLAAIDEDVEKRAWARLDELTKS